MIKGIFSQNIFPLLPERKIQSSKPIVVFITLMYFKFFCYPKKKKNPLEANPFSAITLWFPSSTRCLLPCGILKECTGNSILITSAREFFQHSSIYSSRRDVTVPQLNQLNSRLANFTSYCLLISLLIPSTVQSLR